MKYFILFLGFCFLCSVASQCQTDTLTFEKLRSYRPDIRIQTDRFVQYYNDSVGGFLRMNALKSRKKQIDPINRNRALIIQQYVSAKGTDADTTFTNAETMEPLMYRTHIRSSGYKEHVVFNAENIMTDVVMKDSTKHTTHAAGKNSFVSTTLEDVISILPLKQGYSIVLKIVNAGINHAYTSYDVKVTGRQKVRLADHSLTEVFIVEGKFAGATAGTVWWFTTDKHILLKKDFMMRNGTHFIEERLM
jgi:hypothetical protein